ncbi:MAG: polysaccharide deacetylase, partial [Nakamurella sp.]
MRSSYLVTGLVLVLAVVTGVLIYQGNETSTSASSMPGTSVNQGDAYAQDEETTAAEVTVSAGNRPPTNVPMTKLAPGDKAPQFIIFSFDGAGSHQRWNEFMAAAEPTNSRFTGFLSGIYLLGDSAKDAGAYTGPGHATGK